MFLSAAEMNLLPFDRTALLTLFAHYNEAVWPWQVLWLALAFAALGLLHPDTRGALKTRGVAAILAGLWAWMAVVFHFAFFSTIQPTAWLFGLVEFVGCRSRQGIAFCRTLSQGSRTMKAFRQYPI